MSEYDTATVCRVLKVSKSGYYKHTVQSESEKTEAENKVINCFEKHKENYGRIRIRKALLVEGVDISEYKIAKILKKYGLVAKSGRTGRTKQAKPTEKQYIEEKFNQGQIFRKGSKLSVLFGYYGAKMQSQQNISLWNY